MGMYNTVYYGGDYQDGDRDMIIQLYPNFPGQLDSVNQKGTTITEPLKQACEELLNYNSIDYYKIEWFNVEWDDYNYPEIERNDDDNGNDVNWGGEFWNYLKNERQYGDPNNGTGSDLTQLRGVHYLVHDWDCEAGLVGGYEGTYSCEGSGSTAFTTGYAMWTSDTCLPNDLERNSAIQEALHPFILENEAYYDGDGDGTPLYNKNDEHSAGEITSQDRITPMVTYHTNEDDVVGEGECAANGDFDGYTQYLTWCTKKAVKRTASLDCI